MLKITLGRRVDDKATGDRSLVKAVIMVVLLPPSAMDGLLVPSVSVT